MDDQQQSQDLQEEQPIVEAEVVEETNASINDQTAVLFSLEEMIKNYIESLDKLGNDLKQHRQMFADAFINNPTYRELEEQAKEAAKKRNSTREQILAQPAMRELGQKIKDMSSDVREKKASLSDYLLEYQRMTGATEIEDKDGEARQIVNSAKLIKRSSKEVANSKRK